MGVHTTQQILRWQAHAGLDVPSGRRRQILDEALRMAHDLIEVLILERAGIRDGDGFWHGAFPVDELAEQLACRLDGYLRTPVDAPAELPVPPPF